MKFAIFAALIAIALPAPALGAEGRRFESCLPDHPFRNEKVPRVGTRGTFHFSRAGASETLAELHAEELRPDREVA